MPGLWRRLFPPVRSGLTVLEGLGRIDLHYAAIEGDVKRIKALLRSGSDPNHQDPEGLTPLHMAAIHNQPASLPVLLKAGARVDLPDKAGNHPLFRAVMSSNGDCRVIRLLLAAGADPDHENHHGNSPRSTANLIANYDVERCFERE